MNIIEIKEDIHQLIDQVDDHFLKAVHAMLIAYQEKEQNDPIAGYDIYGNPKQASEMMSTYEERLAAMEEGKYITIENLRKESESWLKATK